MNNLDEKEAEKEVREFLVSSGQIGKFDEIRSVEFAESETDFCIVKILRNTQSDFPRLETFLVWKDKMGKWRLDKVKIAGGPKR